MDQAIEAGLSSKLPPAVRHHRQPPKLLPVRVKGYAPNSHLNKIVFSHPNFSAKNLSTGLVQAGAFQRPSNLRASRSPPRSLQRPARFSKSCEGQVCTRASRPPWKEAKNAGAIRVFPAKENQCRLQRCWTWLDAELYLPMCGRSPDKLYTSVFHRLLLPLSYPVRTCFFSV